MKAAHLLGLTLCLAAAPAARADVIVRDGGLAPYRGVGLGAIFGDPTALSLSLRLDDNNALQFLAGWGFADPYGSRVNLILDYQFHFLLITPSTGSAGVLSPYVGVGGKIGLHERNPGVTAGIRVPIGLSFFIGGTPLEIFAEIAPGIGIAPSVDPLLDGGIGLRFYP